MTTTTPARLQILAAAILFSTGGAAIKLCSFSSWQIASFRSGIAAALLWLVLPASRRFLHPKAIGVGAAYALCLTLFVAANKATTALNTIFLQSTAPLYILLLAPWLLREPIRRRDLVFMAILGLGMATLLLGGERPRVTAPNPPLGNLLAAASGVFWALTVVGLRSVGKADPGGSSPTAAAAVLAGNLLAFVFCLPWALPVSGGQTADWLAILYLGVFQIGLAYVFLTAAIRKVPALEAALLLLLEPVLNPLWAWLLQGETPSAWSMLGGAIILAGVVIMASFGDSNRNSRTGCH